MIAGDGIGDPDEVCCMRLDCRNQLFLRRLGRIRVFDNADGEKGTPEGTLTSAAKRKFPKPSSPMVDISWMARAHARAAVSDNPTVGSA
jgi:16S rRNA G1207 methylase RsmC